MARKKLRNCSKCGVRHGPPIGMRCNRAEEEFRRLNEEMGETPEDGSKDDVAGTVEKTAEEKATGEEGITKPNEEQKGLQGAVRREETPEEDGPSFSEYRRQRAAERETERAGDEPRSTMGDSQPGFYYQVPWQFFPPPT